MAQRRGLKIEFRLQILPRGNAEAWVGYIPALRLYAQAKSEERLKQALEQTASSFIALCAERRILDKVMHERGLRSCDATQRVKDAGGQYVICGAEGYEYTEAPSAPSPGRHLATMECRA